MNGNRTKKTRTEKSNVTKRKKTRQRSKEIETDSARAKSTKKSRRVLGAAALPEVVIKFSGTFDEVAAKIDDEPIDTPTAKLQLKPGRHELEWKVTGNEGDKYKISITGSQPPWSDEFEIPAGGVDLGLKKFKV